MTVHFSEVTQVTTTEWPWPWHPDIHWYHKYLNLSSLWPKAWDALHLGVLTQLEQWNISHPAFKWIAGITPNFTAWDELYNKEYKGTGRRLYVCIPQVVGKVPDWFPEYKIWGCWNYTPAVMSDRRYDEFDFIYNREKPSVDINIALAVIITMLGVPGR